MIITRIILTYAGEYFESLSWMGLIAQVWSLPMLIYMNAVDLSQTNKWVVWTVLTLFLSLPSGECMSGGGCFCCFSLGNHYGY